MHYARTRKHRDHGFSFIELLAYMAIAALLILAAIPQFNNYRGAARDASTVSDVRNAATAMEAWAISHPGEEFPRLRSTWRAEPNGAVAVLADLGVKLSDGTSLWIMDRSVWRTPTALGRDYCIYAYNPNGKKYTYYDSPPAAPVHFSYDSAKGGMGVDCNSSP